jgi:uncharacterized SAM-binding protein YcdF (DUF218 family)
MVDRLKSVAQGVLIATGVLVWLVTFTPVVRWAAWPLESRWTNVNQGVLIVLSGSSVTLEGPAPKLLIGKSTYWRAIHAIAVWRGGHYHHILLSGAGAAETIKPLLLVNGIPENAILVEDRSANTHENALFSQPILARLPGPYVLLTSDLHMYRASRSFAHENITVETMPAPDLFKRVSYRLERWDTFWELLIEYVSIAWYRLHGWI